MIHWIASPDHSGLEPYRRLVDPGWLQQQNLFVAEGRLVVERLIDLGGYEVLSCLVNRAAYEALRERLSRVESNVYVCDEPTLTRVTGFHFHRGCLALVRRPRPWPAEHLAGGSMLLALEGIGNPDNVGGLFRSAAALGADGMLLNRTCADPFYRKAVRTSMGAVLRLPFVRVEDWLKGLDTFRSRGFKLVALTPQADAVPIAQFAPRLDAGARLMFLVGEEGAGLEGETLSRADARVRIPIDDGIDSLNVTVAAAIALSHVRSVRLPNLG